MGAHARPYRSTKNGLAIENIDEAWATITDVASADHPAFMAEGGKHFVTITGGG
jgi:hypothetical protein